MRLFWEFFLEGGSPSPCSASDTSMPPGFTSAVTLPPCSTLDVTLPPCFTEGVLLPLCPAEDATTDCSFALGVTPFPCSASDIYKSPGTTLTSLRLLTPLRMSFSSTQDAAPPPCFAVCIALPSCFVYNIASPSGFVEDVTPSNSVENAAPLWLCLGLFSAVSFAVAVASLMCSALGCHPSAVWGRSLRLVAWWGASRLLPALRSMMLLRTLIV